MFINDLFAEGGPARGNRSLWAKTLIGNQVSIGSNATVLPVEICDNVVIGAGSVVTKNILEPGVYAGNPAKKMKEKNDFLGQLRSLPGPDLNSNHQAVTQMLALNLYTSTKHLDKIYEH